MRTLIALGILTSLLVAAGSGFSSKAAGHSAIASCSQDAEFNTMVRSRVVAVAMEVAAPWGQELRDSLQLPLVELPEQITRVVTDSLCTRAGVLMNQTLSYSTGTPRMVALYRVGDKLWGEDPALEFGGRAFVFIFDSMLVGVVHSIGM